MVLINHQLLAFATDELSLRVGQTLAGLINATLVSTIDIFETPFHIFLFREMRKQILLVDPLIRLYLYFCQCRVDRHGVSNSVVWGTCMSHTHRAFRQIIALAKCELQIVQSSRE